MEELNLSILSQAPKEIGTIDKKIVAVYPPSPSRVCAIMKAVAASKSEMFTLVEKMTELRQKAAANPDKDLSQETTVITDEIKKAVMAQIENIAPIIVQITAKPSEGYKWVPVLAEKDISEGMSVQTVIDILTAYEEVSNIPEALKKITALSR